MTMLPLYEVAAELSATAADLAAAIDTGEPTGPLTSHAASLLTDLSTGLGVGLPLAPADLAALPLPGCGHRCDGTCASRPPRTVYLAALALPYRWRAPRLVFVNSMSDLFHARVPEPFIRDVFAVMAATPAHTYQVLTKRPRRALRLAEALPWPSNVWLGTSIETARYRWRADTLRAVPAAVRFISAEPLLGPLPGLNLAGIGWVIAGGESGPGHRPPDGAWFRALRDQCTAASVPFFFKQWGGPTPKAGGRLLDGRTWDQMPATSTGQEGIR